MFAFRFLYDNLKFAECMLLIVRMNACFYNSIFLLHASQHLPKGTSGIIDHYHLNVNILMLDLLGKWSILLRIFFSLTIIFRK